MNDKKKWDVYYNNESKLSPPWESDMVFHKLPSILVSNKLDSIEYKNIIELGCGRSQTAIYLANNDYNVTAIDFCEKAINDAKTISDAVNWLLLDILDDNLFDELGKESYDMVFDMQCFHVLRDINESKAVNVIYNLLRKNGIAIIVVGAKHNDNNDDENVPKPGPSLLTREQLVIPFTHVGFELCSIELSTFNVTEFYLSMDAIPECWIAVFKKVIV